MLVGLVAISAAIILPALPASAASAQCSTSVANSSCSTVPVSTSGPLHMSVHANTSSCGYSIIDVNTNTSVSTGGAGQGSQPTLDLSGLNGTYTLSLSGTGCWGELRNGTSAESCQSSPSTGACTTAPVSANGPLSMTVHALTSSCIYRILDAVTNASVSFGGAGQGSTAAFTLSNMYGTYKLSLTGAGCWGELRP